MGIKPKKFSGHCFCSLNLLSCLFTQLGPFPKTFLALLNDDPGFKNAYP